MYLIRSCPLDMLRLVLIVGWPESTRRTRCIACKTDSLLVTCTILHHMVTAAAWVDLKVLLRRYRLQLSEIFHEALAMFMQHRGHNKSLPIPVEFMPSYLQRNTSSALIRSNCHDDAVACSDGTVINVARPCVSTSSDSSVQRAQAQARD